MQRRFRFFLFSSISFFVLLSLQACGEPPEKEQPAKLVKAIRIGDFDLLSQRAFPGRAEAAQEATLSFRVSGQLESRPVDVGDTVADGTVLAQLDPTDFKNALNAARGEMAKAQAALEDTEADYERVLSVQKEDSGAISQKAVDRAKAAKSVAQASVDSASSAVSLARDRLGYTVLKAPFAGEIVATYVEAHETLVAKQPVVRLLDQSAIEFKVDVPESLIGYARQVTSANVRFDIQPDIDIPATIKEVGREASRGTRTYPVTLLLQATNKFEILPGMAGKAYIQAELPEKAAETGIEIPAAAFFSEGDKSQSFVWIVVEGKLQKRQVTVGLPSDYGVRVQSGLKPGELVVVAGVHSLSEGQSVRVIDAAEKREAP